MGKYLQTNGTSEYLKTPSVTFDEVIMDFKPRHTPTTEYYIDIRTGVANSYLYRNTSNVDFTSGSSLFVNGMYYNGVKFNNSTNTIPYDTRGLLRLVLSTQGTDDVVFFANNAGTPSTCMAADVFDIKLLLGGVVQAHYDMSLGHVQDQSGNGNHATLTGGTWVEEPTGDTGTDVAVSYTTKNVIYREMSNSFSSKQQIYADQLRLFDSKLVQYKDDARNYSTKQVISKDLLHSYSTKQIITLVGGKEVHTVFPTKQQVYLVRSDVFATRQELKGRFYKTLNLYTSSQSEIKLDTSLGDTVIEIVSYMGQTVYQPNTLRTVSEMEVIA